MVIVPMTRDINERPPKIFGPFTKKQLLGTIVGAAIIIFFLFILPFDFVTRLLIGAGVSIPAFVFGYLPTGIITPMTYIRYYVLRVINGKQVIPHDGDTAYSAKKKPQEDFKITRHKEYKGIR